MPTVQTETRLFFRLYHLRHTGIRRVKFLILTRPRFVKTVRTAEIILGSGAANRRKFLIAIHEELDLAFAPPARAVRAPGHIGSDVLSLSANAVENRIILFIRDRIDTPELSMQVAHVCRNLSQRVIDLVIQDHILFIDIGHRNLVALAKRHLPVAVKSAAGIYANGQGGNCRILSETAREEIARGAFDGGSLLAVPIESQNVEPVVPRRSHPDMLDRPGTFDIGHYESLAGFDPDRR